MKKHHDLARKIKAFTMIELVLVIVILGIVAATAYPVLTGLSEPRINNAARRIRSDIRYAQEIALTTHNKTWILFNTSEDKYSFFVEDPSNPGKANRLAMEDPLTHEDFVVNLNTGEFEGVTISNVDFGGTNEVEFNRMGVPYDGNQTELASNGTVTLNGSKNITVTKETGLVIE